jgi:hypothetical protein
VALVPLRHPPKVSGSAPADRCGAVAEDEDAGVGEGPQRIPGAFEGQPEGVGDGGAVSTRWVGSSPRTCQVAASRQLYSDPVCGGARSHGCRPVKAPFFRFFIPPRRRAGVAPYL